MDFECPLCSGQGCDECDGGRYEITQCPKDFVGDLWDVLGYVDLFSKGLPPVTGGALEQTRWFLDVSRFVWSEQAYWRNRLGVSG